MARTLARESPYALCHISLRSCDHADTFSVRSPNLFSRAPISACWDRRRLIVLLLAVWVLCYLFDAQVEAVDFAHELLDLL